MLFLNLLISSSFNGDFGYINHQVSYSCKLLINGYLILH